MAEKKIAGTKRKNDGDYSSMEYWNGRYQNASDFEWYYSFETLKPLIESSMARTSSSCVLEIGCGDNPLATSIAELNVDGSTYGIDYSEAVIDALNKKPCKGLIFQRMDARTLAYDSSMFDLIIDKGTLDAMLCAKKRKEALSNARKILTETVRVMKDESKFMLISHIEVESSEFDDLIDEIITPALESKLEVLWSIEAHVINGSSQNGTVYVISSTPRRFTRNRAKAPAEVSFRVLQYDDDDVEEEGEMDENGEDIVYCMPCET